MSEKIVLAGGGTAGHVNPLLATALELRSRGYEVVALGTKQGLETTLVPAAGIELVTIERVPLPRKPSLQFFSLPRRMKQAIAQCRSVLQGAQALVGFGGYVSTPAYLAARKMGIPIIIHEQNARPGLANRVGARWASALGLTFPSTPLIAKQGITEVTGLPLRPAIQELAATRSSEEGRLAAREQAASRLGIDPKMETLLITGGSLGALNVNRAMIAAAAQLPLNVQVLHLTGKGKDQEVSQAVSAAGVAQRWRVIDYLSTMEDALAVADLVVCRSGAGTVAEMTALGLPCVYVPLPIGNGEQKLNAADHVAHGGALLVADSDLNAHYVCEKIFPLLGSTELQQMAQASRALAQPDGALKLADLIESTLHGKKAEK